MRERAHKKGEVYQKDVKHWLSRTTFLGFEAALFGDAYDVTKKACTIGDIVFDFSLKLGPRDLARNVVYGECKYRDEKKGNVNTEFREFLKRVRDAMVAADTDDAASAVFVFLSNVPPDCWRNYLANRVALLRDVLSDDPNRPPDDQLLNQLAAVIHLLVLDARIVGRN